MNDDKATAPCRICGSVRLSCPCRELVEAHDAMREALREAEDLPCLGAFEIEECGEQRDGSEVLCTLCAYRGKARAALALAEGENG